MKIVEAVKEKIRELQVRRKIEEKRQTKERAIVPPHETKPDYEEGTCQ